MNSYVFKHADKEILLNVLQHSLTLVFVETKRGANELEHWLSRNGFPAIAIHGDKVQMVSLLPYFLPCFIMILPS